MCSALFFCWKTKLFICFLVTVEFSISLRFPADRMWIPGRSLNSIKTSCYSLIWKVFFYIYLHIPNGGVGFVFVRSKRELEKHHSMRVNIIKEMFLEHQLLNDEKNIGKGNFSLVYVANYFFRSCTPNFVGLVLCLNF